MKGLNEFIDDMTWPNSGDRMSEIERILIHGTAERKDLMSAAGIIAAYRELLNCTEKKRKYVVKKLKDRRLNYEINKRAKAKSN